MLPATKTKASEKSEAFFCSHLNAVSFDNITYNIFISRI